MPLSISPLTAAALAVMANLAPLTAAPPEGWQLVFSDEFEGHSLDAAKWGTTMGFIGTHGPRYHKVGRDLVQELLAEPEISSVQITFHEGKPPESAEARLDPRYEFPTVTPRSLNRPSCRS